jgi:hypothetical protein
MSFTPVQLGQRALADLISHNGLWSGRVPHVRQSVHGPKTDSSNAFTTSARILDLGRSLFRPHEQKRWKGATPRLFPPMVPDFLHEAPPTDACAAFIKESRMEFINARNSTGNPGVRFGEHGAPVQTIDRGGRSRDSLNVSQEYTKLRSRSCQARHHGPLRTTQKTCDLLIR